MPYAQTSVKLFAASGEMTPASLEYGGVDGMGFYMQQVSCGPLAGLLDNKKLYSVFQPIVVLGML